MANICENIIQINANKKAISKMLEVAKTHKETLRGEKSEVTFSFYPFCKNLVSKPSSTILGELGTNYIPYIAANEEFNILIQDGAVLLYFDTKWSAPIGAASNLLKWLQKIDKEAHIRMSYQEYGMNFCGIYISGCGDLDCNITEDYHYLDEEFIKDIDEAELDRLSNIYGLSSDELKFKANEPDGVYLFSDFYKENRLG